MDTTSGTVAPAKCDHIVGGANCKISDGTSCTDCMKGYYLNTGVSPKTCTTSTIAECSYESDDSSGGATDCTLGGCAFDITFDGSTAACVAYATACDSTCETCHGTEATQCVTCPVDHHLTNTGECETYTGTCHYTCGLTAPNWWTLITESGGTNVDCTGGSINDCLTCRKGWFHPTGTSSEACSPCVRNCEVCTADTAAACTVWNDGFYGESDDFGKHTLILYG